MHHFKALCHDLRAVEKNNLWISNWLLWHPIGFGRLILKKFKREACFKDNFWMITVFSTKKRLTAALREHISCMSNQKIRF